MSHLQTYVNRDNDLRELFNKEPRPFPTTPSECQPYFASLTGELSPENLTCDGELSYAQVQEKATFLYAVWAELEEIYGQKVTEHEAWNWSEPTIGF